MAIERRKSFDDRRESMTRFYITLCDQKERISALEAERDIFKELVYDFLGVASPYGNFTFAGLAENPARDTGGGRYLSKLAIKAKSALDAEKGGKDASD